MSQLLFKFVLVIPVLWACSFEELKVPDPSLPSGADNSGPAATYSDVDKIQAYGQFLLPVLRSHKCVECHGVGQVPTFAVSDSYTAFKAGEKYIDINAPLGSRFYRRPKIENHNCLPNCDTIAESILKGLEAYRQQLLTKKLSK